MGLLNQMSSTGKSASWVASKSNAQRILCLFAESVYALALKPVPKEVCQGPVSHLPEEILRSAELREQFAGYLYDGYIIESGANEGHHLFTSPPAVWRTS